MGGVRAFAFVAPLVALAIVWAVVVRAFDVNPRIFPDITAVAHAAASLGAGRWPMLTEVLIPGALPNIVTGIRTGMGFAWRGLIAAEMIATSQGLGYMLFLARDFYRTEVIVMGMIVIGLLWLAIDRLLLAPLERATIERWGMVRA